tara:strand:- start:1244 stop:1576 length:333 start_codon:yes stop_codon:yes gene_type:complete
MKEKVKSSELLEEADVLMKSVDYWNSKMDNVINDLNALSKRDFHTVGELQKMEKLEDEINVLSRRLDVEYGSIETMEGKIETQLALNKEKKKSLKSKKSKRTKPKKTNND